MHILQHSVTLVHKLTFTVVFPQKFGQDPESMSD